MSPVPTSQRPVVLTMGDPAGVGPETIAHAFRLHPAWSQRCVVAGDVATLRRAVAVTGGNLPVAVVDGPADVGRLPPGCVPVWPVVQLPALLPFGRVDARAGEAAAACVRAATQAALAGDVAAVVTAPLHKEAFAAAGYPYPGHTEYLQTLAAEAQGVSPAHLPVRMMLSNHELRTVLVSIHVSLREALAAVTLGNVLETLHITAAHGRLRQPSGWRIAVAGVNPHAGEGGLFGREEIEVLQPAIRQAQAEGLDVSGPHAPDTVFMRARQGDFDVVVAMYHDQGLIPVKYMGLDHGVNTTLGLPFVRTSPDHGTAFDLAGTGRADPASLVAAVGAAVSVC
jgi:4-hydroxythreonine-4-phosphate dehydrogenase